MLRKIFLALAVSLAIFTSTAHAQNFDKPKIAVIDFAQFNGAITSDLNADKVGKMCVDYIWEAMVDSGEFFVVDKDFVAEKLSAEKFEGEGIISPSIIRKIGEIVGVDYLIIGGVYGVGNDQSVLEIVSNGAKINSVKACLIARMVEVRTGKILKMAKGRGESKSSLVKAGEDKFGFITVGTKKVPQVSVHNAIEKAARALVEDFISQS